MTSQDLIYSVLAKPLGNQVTPVKAQVKEVSDSEHLKPLVEDEQAIEQYMGGERRQGRKERRKKRGRRSSEVDEQQTPDKTIDDDGHLDIYV